MSPGALTGIVNRAVREPKGGIHTIECARSAWIEGIWPGDLPAAMSSLDELDHSIHGHLRGDLTRFVSAHTVGHYQQPEIDVNEKSILIHCTRPAIGRASRY